MSADGARFKPPLTAFIVWGGMMLGFLFCVSCKRWCRRGRFCWYECEEERAEGYDEEETYERLSSRRRQELDNLRSIAILRRLARFTLTLKKENTMKRLPDSEIHTLSEEVQQLDMDGNSAENDEERDGPNDIEMGAANATTTNVAEKQCDVVPSEEETDETADEEESEYTHILVPLPSYDTRGVHVTEWVACSSDNEKKCTSTRRKLFPRKLNGKIACDDAEKDVEEGRALWDDEGEPDEPKERITEKRDVPRFCAVCLMEYSIAERVCWSSNPECAHVFHEDCMLQWLVSLGRNRSKRQHFPRHPSEKRLLDYDLVCPCCRQTFILKSLVHASDEEEKEGTYDVRSGSEPSMIRF